LRSIAALLLFSYGMPMLFGQQPLPSGLNASQATQLANLMCRQLPNLTSARDAVIGPPPPKDLSIKKEPQERVVWDDVYDALVELGGYSVPCLVDRLTDARWMPDPAPPGGSKNWADPTVCGWGSRGVCDDSRRLGTYPQVAATQEVPLRLQDLAWEVAYPSTILGFGWVPVREGRGALPIQH
jgi:hypothetical protein